MMATVRLPLPAALTTIIACAVVVATTVAAGCAGPQQRRTDWSGPPTVAPMVAPAITPTTTVPRQPSIQAERPGSAPTNPYRVGIRRITVTRSPGRVLVTTIWYPVKATDGGVAAGRFPVVVFSHGLTGLPSDYRALATRWAAAGFVVVAPAYPHTSRGVKKFDIADVLNQPADASYVLTRALALDRAPGDALRGHLDAGRIAAAGHSAGAITTVGLFANGRDARLNAGIVLAGNALGMGNAYVGKPAALLFAHGDADPVTPYGLSRATYEAVPSGWPKAFLTLAGERHIDPYLHPASASFGTVAAVTTDFLRWTLYGDAAAKARIAKAAGKAYRLEDRL